LSEEQGKGMGAGSGRVGQWALVGLVCAVSIGVLAGCGGSDPTAPLAAAMRDAAHARAFRIVGSAVERGLPIEFDLDVVPHEGLKGSYEVTGSHIAVINANGRTYVRFSGKRGARFFGSVLPRSLSTRWITSGNPTLTAEISRLVAFSYGFNSNDTNGFARLGSTTVDGARALKFANALSGADVTVSEAARPYPLLLKLRSHGESAAFSRWNEYVPIRAPTDAVSQSQLRRPPKVHSGTLTAGTVLPSTPHDGVRTFRAAGYALQFDYPEQLFVAPLGPARLAGGYHKASTVGLVINNFSMIAVSQFQGLSIPVNATLLHALYHEFERPIAALAGHPVAATVSSAHGIPLVEFAPFTASLQGTPITERVFNAFAGDDEYELRCQFTAADKDAIEQACSKMISTLVRISPPA
jgi:hypothetical protein